MVGPRQISPWWVTLSPIFLLVTLRGLVSLGSAAVFISGFTVTEGGGLLVVLPSMLVVDVSSSVCSQWGVGLGLVTLGSLTFNVNDGLRPFVLTTSFCATICAVDGTHPGLFEAFDLRFGSTEVPNVGSSLSSSSGLVTVPMSLEFSTAPIFPVPLAFGESGIWDYAFSAVFRWFKFTLKPPNSITDWNFFLAIWDTSHWNFFVKFGLKTPYVIS